jgi:hypothetical protein
VSKIPQYSHGLFTQPTAAKHHLSLDYLDAADPSAFIHPLQKPIFVSLYFAAAEMLNCLLQGADWRAGHGPEQLTAAESSPCLTDVLYFFYRHLHFYNAQLVGQNSHFQNIFTQKALHS